jgi:NAD(P)-dependent dehydrogenase (short-subunit alcohol dehydrogenase family)
MRTDNNAGLFMVTPVTEYASADYAAMIGVNFTDLFALTQRGFRRCSRSARAVIDTPDAWARRPRRPGEDASSGQDR